MSGGKANRRKGHDFERLVARLLRHIGYQAIRHLEYQSNSSGYDIEALTASGNLRRVSCKVGRQVPLTAYGHILRDGRATLSEMLGERVICAYYAAGHAWIRKAIGDCHELWFKHPGWPIVRILGPADRLR